LGNSQRKVTEGAEILQNIMGRTFIDLLLVAFCVTPDYKLGVELRRDDPWIPLVGHKSPTPVLSAPKLYWAQVTMAFFTSPDGTGRLVGYQLTPLESQGCGATRLYAHKNSLGMMIGQNLFLAAVGPPV